MDAVLKLVTKRASSCRFHSIITGGSQDSDSDDVIPSPGQVGILAEEPGETIDGLNPSQMAAVRSCKAPLSLIWGPPGSSCELGS
jgi:regulator of nonsense transcripts 1